ncbi:selenium-binding family protein [Kibdelosporangium philippinense]|uniref:Selenium-binding family protein n=1 Tax=Kibdelosporangium philippinense TaxID=211113 RepID=A0ABS8Z647_9PSEU|nr:selenium-binding family protein [Kibdelosporangium philippinense]MCE7002043.1 selenium-binding family protein [Kibdelosporangium philippinense]
MADIADPTFYRTPSDAMTAAPESLAYVVAFDPAGRARDALTVVDCDETSSTFGQVRQPSGSMPTSPACKVTTPRP